MKTFFILLMTTLFIFTGCTDESPTGDAIDTGLIYTKQGDVVIVPVASTDTSQTVQGHKIVVLDAAKSEGAASYHWKFTSKPAGSQVILNEANSIKSTFLPDVVGDYIIKLTVDNDVFPSSSIMVTVSVINTLPIANIVAPSAVHPIDTVVLSASNSSDIDSDVLTYKWTILDQPTSGNATLSDNSAVNPSFTANMSLGVYKVQLIVNDGLEDSLPITTTIMAVNNAPVAKIDAPLATHPITDVMLSGRLSSDLDNDNLTYKWSLVSQPAGSNIQFNNDTNKSTFFRVNIPGTYKISLVVNDGFTNSIVTESTITATNTTPLAKISAPTTVHPITDVVLSGSLSSDADNDTLSYQWNLVSQPAGSNVILTSDTNESTLFKASIPGNYKVQLIVNDGFIDSPAVETTIMALNAVPVISAGSDQTVHASQQVQLSGSATDADGDTLTYRWTMLSAPGTLPTLSDDTVLDPSFLASDMGIYELFLVVSDGFIDVNATVTVTATNTAPIASISAPSTVHPIKRVYLYGSGSSDDDNDTLTYQWSLISQPTNGQAILFDDTNATTSFTAVLLGEYKFKLIVNDGFVDSQEAFVTVKATNSAPVADAGRNQNVKVSDLVYLDASNSYDEDDDYIRYKWILTMPDSSVGTLSDDSSVLPTFTATVGGTYTLDLNVTDNFGASSLASITVTTATIPVAYAGEDQEVHTTSTVRLDGSQSYDPDTDLITYKWTLLTQPAGSSITLSSDTVVSPTFKPLVDGIYSFQLVVNDGTSDSLPDTVLMVSTQHSAPPIADAGEDIYVYNHPLVTLDGSGSHDPNGAVLTYEWSLVSKPSGSSTTLSNPNIVNPTVTSDINGSYVFELLVNNGYIDSKHSNVVLTSSPQSPPVADAGNDQYVDKAKRIDLNGSKSYDPDNHILAYAWRFVSRPAGSSVVLMDDNTSTPYFIMDTLGSYVLELTVNDGIIDSQPSFMKIEKIVAEDFTMILDVDERNITYNWQVGAKVPSIATATVSTDGLYGHFSLSNDIVIYQKTIETNTSDSAILDITIDGTLVSIKITLDGLYWKNVSSSKFTTILYENYTIAIKSDNTIWAWGNNRFGQLGDGTNTPRLVPVQESTLSNDWKSITAGKYHTLAIKENGTLWAWGWNRYGQLGNGQNQDSLVPVQESTFSTNWKKVSTGFNHSIAIKTDGTIWSWGSNTYGQLCDGTNIDRYVPTQEVTSANNWNSISAGNVHSVAIKNDGTLWSWGSNYFSQLGDGSKRDRSNPSQEYGSSTWLHVSAGDDHTVAIRNDGTIWSWGQDRHGQMGNGRNDHGNIPRQEIYQSTNWRKVSAGSNYSLGIKDDGSLWGWGENTSGQLGKGNSATTTRPEKAGNYATDYIVIAPGDTHTMAIKNDGTLWGWGDNTSGQLGNNTTNSTYNPILIFPRK